MTIVVGSVDSRSEGLVDLLKLSLEHVHRSRGEDGYIEHNVQIDCEDPLRLRFFERWRDASRAGGPFRPPELAHLRAGGRQAMCEAARHGHL